MKKLIKYFALCLVFFAGGIAITDDYSRTNNNESAFSMLDPEDPPGQKINMLDPEDPPGQKINMFDPEDPPGYTM
ncbi:hypothetical protein [Priestia taiwanensis]|uniref:Secreted protein n=1 Tax=Priestia taiwanensis TaxID=1347902 RepID=A0A917EKK3_9BACI|nr:hypothetical protein [Priestia taiwanensis]MBM7361865.1 hypothetical protein [Priestia taiwanensis]GGE57540.1 hypothetical protein GCM10007140_04910 [Priestia taiwanensis]